jgi:hypothetical protein
LQRFRSKRANASEPERTPNLAILATGSDALAAVGFGGFSLPRTSVMQVPEERWSEAHGDGGSSL